MVNLPLIGRAALRDFRVATLEDMALWIVEH